MSAMWLPTRACFPMTFVCEFLYHTCDRKYCSVSAALWILALIDVSLLDTAIKAALWIRQVYYERISLMRSPLPQW
jgi:hypothetical protein